MNKAVTRITFDRCLTLSAIRPWRTGFASTSDDRTYACLAAPIRSKLEPAY